MSLYEETVSEAHERLMEAIWTKEGATCPCCEQYAKGYLRKIHRSQVRIMVALVYLEKDFPDRESFHINEIKRRASLNSGGDHGKLEHYDLLREVSEGFWHSTENTLDYLRGELSFRPVYLYDNVVKKRKLEWLTVHDVQRFDINAIFDTEDF